MDDALVELRREWDAEEGSFLLRLRSDLVWDRAAFTRLEHTMRVVCAQHQDAEDLPRWLAEGFYYVSHFVADWTSHPHFHRPEPQGYYEDCLERLSDLADWFFRGEHAYLKPHVWADL